MADDDDDDDDNSTAMLSLCCLSNWNKVWRRQRWEQCRQRRLCNRVHNSLRSKFILAIVLYNIYTVKHLEGLWIKLN